MLMVRDNLKTLPERNPPPLRGSPRASTAPHTAVVGQFAGSMIACGARGALRLWLRTAPRSRPREDSPASPGPWSSRKLTRYPAACLGRTHDRLVLGERREFLLDLRVASSRHLRAEVLDGLVGEGFREPVD